MDPGAHKSIAAAATIIRTSSDDVPGFAPPRVKYNPHLICGEHVELNGTREIWDIVVRRILGVGAAEKRADVVFQFASPRAPHHLLRTGLQFELVEGAVKPVWTGHVYRTWMASRRPEAWVAQ